MFILKSSVKIGKLVFKQIHDIKIVKSVELLSDTAVIKLPISAVLGNKESGFERKKLEQIIKAGDTVEITLEYEGVFKNIEFKGFVAFIKPNFPTLTIECEDLVYKIRKKRIHKNFGKTTLKEVLNFIVNDTEVKLSGNIPDVNFDKFLLKNVNGAKALQKIKESYGLHIYVNDQNELYAGLQQDIQTDNRVFYDIYKNVVNHDLEFRKAEDVRIYVKVIGVKKDNTKIEVVVGETDGEQKTIHKYNISDKNQLKQIGEAALQNLKYTGYKGGIASFLIPFATRGMAAVLKDKNYVDRIGSYFITKVETTFGQNGARRKIELGRKLI